MSSGADVPINVAVEYMDVCNVKITLCIYLIFFSSDDSKYVWKFMVIIHSFFLNNHFFLLRVGMDPKPVHGTLGTKRIRTFYGVLVHYRSILVNAMTRQVCMCIGQSWAKVNLY